MTEENQNIFEILKNQSVKIGELLDYNQTIVRVARIQAENWKALSRGYMECAQMAEEIAESCALVARISVDKAGDIISTEWGIDKIDGDEELEEEEGQEDDD